jgi:hypothetical protein
VVTIADLSTVLFAALQNIEPMCGKAKTMLSHLSKYKHIIQDTQSKAQHELNKSRDKPGESSNKQTPTPTDVPMPTPLQSAAKRQKTQQHLQVVVTK